jgi:O-antigen/teichoic acid export membrane protein
MTQALPYQAGLDGRHQDDVIRGLGVSGRKVWAWLTSSDIPGQTETERSSERNRRAVASSVAALAFRASSFVVVLVSVPLTLDLLGPVRFGLWMTIASVVALMSVTDLGIANGVLNSVARAYGQGDRRLARQYVASGFVSLSGAALALSFLLVVLYPIVPWASLYNVAHDPLAASEAGPATAVLVGTFLVGLPLSLIGAVRAAYQESFVQSAFAALGNVLTIVLLVIAVALRASLTILVLATASGPLIAGALNLVVLLRLQRPWLLPQWADVTTSALRSVLGVGLGFMVLQMAYLIGFSTDFLVVAHIVGPSAATDYAIVHRLFSIPSALAAIALVPLWPAYREAISRQDLYWVRRTLRRSIRLTCLAIMPLSVILIILGPSIVELWTGAGARPPIGLYIAMGLFTIAYAIANAYGMVLNGAQAMRYLLATWSAMALLNLVTSIYLASRIGVAGVALGSAIAVVAALIIPALPYVPRLLGRLEGASGRGLSAPPHRGSAEVLPMDESAAK